MDGGGTGVGTWSRRPKARGHSRSARSWFCMGRDGVIGHRWEGAGGGGCEGQRGAANTHERETRGSKGGVEPGAVRASAGAPTGRPRKTPNHPSRPLNSHCRRGRECGRRPGGAAEQPAGRHLGQVKVRQPERQRLRHGGEGGRKGAAAGNASARGGVGAPPPLPLQLRLSRIAAGPLLSARPVRVLCGLFAAWRDANPPRVRGLPARAPPLRGRRHAKARWRSLGGAPWTASRVGPNHGRLSH